MPTSYPGSFLQVEKEPIKSLAQRTTYLPQTFNRCQGEIHIVQDSMSDSEGNKKTKKESKKLYF